MIVWPILWILAFVAMVIATIVVAVAEGKARRRQAEVVRQQQAALQQAAMGDSSNMGEAAAIDDGFGVPGQGDFANFDDFK